jgi:hypothetical protein
MSYNRKAITDALSKMNKARKPKQPKDIIKDPEGQYKYPGVPTRIASDNITMQGVSYPVLGVDNLGNQQLMLPGAEYVFPGADYVDEFPMMQGGGQLSPEEFAKKRAAYEKMIGREIPFLKQTKIVSAPPVTLPVEAPKKISTGYSGFIDDGALMYNPVEITTTVKDKWNRPRETSAWYGFDPDKKEFTSKDKWGRNPGDKKYGYDENRELWTLGSKGDKRINISKPYVFDDKQLIEINTNTDAEECLRDNDGNCLQSAFSYYDKYVAPNLGLPDSWKIKENANLSSGPNHNRYSKVGESWDSWELAGGLLEKGGKLFFTSSNNISLNAKLENKTPEEQEKYWLDLNLPIGTIINGGFRGRNKNNGKITYNESVGLAPSNHSAVVIGHDKKGIPVIFDFGKIHKITDPTALINSNVQGINNIIAPKEVLEMTYDKIKNNKSITSTTSVKPLSKKLIRESIFENAWSANNNKTNVNLKDKSVTPAIKSNLKEMYRFGDLLVDNKEKYIKNFNLPNDVYDEYVRRAIALAFVETGGGDETTIRLAWGALPYPSYKFKKMGIGTSFGLTQINTDVLWGDSKITKQLNNLGITKDNYDPWKLEHITAATIAMLKNTDKTAKINIKKFPGNNTDMHPAMANWYQWNRPQTFVKGTAQGDAIASKQFMNYYNAVKFQEGGNTSDPGMDAMMKARFAYAHMHGNPSAQRMTYPVDNPYIFTGTEPYTNPDMAGEFGTHYMFSQDNYAVPTIQQDEYGNLIYNPEANYTNPEAIQFDRPEDAEYFAEYYKQITPGMQTGGSTDWKSRIASAMNFQKGGQLSKEEFEKRKAAYKKMTGRDFEPPKSFKPTQQSREYYQNRANQQPVVQTQPTETTQQSRGVDTRREKEIVEAQANTDAKAAENYMHFYNKTYGSDYGAISYEQALQKVRLPDFDKTKFLNMYNLGQPKNEQLQSFREEDQANRTWEVITNPFTAFEYAVATGDMANMPSNINAARMQGYDVGVTPGRNMLGNALNMTINLFDAGDKVIRNVGEGNYLGAGLEAMRFLPSARINTGLGKTAYNYGNDLIQTSRIAGKPKLPVYRNVYRVEHGDYTIPSLDNNVTGRWYTRNPLEANFYIKNLKHPETGQVLKDVDDKVRVIQQKIPDYKMKKYFGWGMPEEARIMSMGPGDLRDFELDQALGPGATKRYESGWLTPEDINKIQTSDYLFNINEGILPAQIVNKNRFANPSFFNPLKRTEFENKQNALAYINNEWNNMLSQNYSRYFPFYKEGGQMSREEFEKRKAAYKKLTGRDFEPPKSFKPSEKARQQYQEKYNQQPTVQQQPSETVNQSRGTNNANIKQELDKSTREEIEERNRQRIEENRTYFEADTRSNAQRERDQFYANQLTDPNIYNQIGNFLDAGIAQVGNFWDYISGGDDWEKELENYKLQRLNPYVSDKDKLKEFVNFGLSNTGNALMTGMEIADGYALARAIPGIQSQVGRYLSKPSISNTPRQLPGSSNAALPPNTRPQLNIQQQRNAELLSEWVNNRGMTGQQLLNFSQRDPDWLRLVEDYVTVTGDRQGINAFLAGGNRRIPTYRSNILDTQPIQNIINTGSIDLRRNRLSAPVIFDPGTLFELATGKGVSLGSANTPTFRNLTTSLVKKPAQKLQNVLTNLDKKMGAFLEKNISTAKKPISITDIEKEVNLLLEKGVGVKKAKDVKIKLETVPGSSQAAIHIDIKDYFKNNKKLLQDAYPDSDIDAWIESVPDGWINSGTIHAPSTIKPTAQTRRFTEIVRGKPKEAGYLHSGPSSPIEVPGLRKKGEFPFTNWDTGLKDNILNNLGISGEYNKALNEVLKSKGYGLYSGGTGHLPDGAKRYVREFLKNRVNIVNPEQAKIFLDQLRDPEVMRLIDNALKNKDQALPPEVYRAMQNVIFKYKKKGGSIQPLDYFDTELTDQEIEQYKKGGCVVVKL